MQKVGKGGSREQRLSKTSVLPNQTQGPESGAPRTPFPEALPAAPLKWVKVVPGPEWRNFRAVSGQGLQGHCRWW